MAGSGVVCLSFGKRWIHPGMLGGVWGFENMDSRFWRPAVVAVHLWLVAIRVSRGPLTAVLFELKRWSSVSSRLACFPCLFRILVVVWCYVLRFCSHCGGGCDCTHRVQGYAGVYGGFGVDRVVTVSVRVAFIA